MRDRERTAVYDLGSAHLCPGGVDDPPSRPHRRDPFATSSLPQASWVKLRPPDFVEVLTPAAQKATDVEMGFKEVIELHESSLLRSLKEGDEDTDRHRGGEGTAM